MSSKGNGCREKHYSLPQRCPPHSLKLGAPSSALVLLISLGTTKRLHAGPWKKLPKIEMRGSE